MKCICHVCWQEDLELEKSYGDLLVPGHMHGDKPCKAGGLFPYLRYERELSKKVQLKMGEVLLEMEREDVPRLLRWLNLDGPYHQYWHTTECVEIIPGGE